MQVIPFTVEYIRPNREKPDREDNTDDEDDEADYDRHYFMVELTEEYTINVMETSYLDIVNEMTKIEVPGDWDRILTKEYRSVEEFLAAATYYNSRNY